MANARARLTIVFTHEFELVPQSYADDVKTDAERLAIDIAQFTEDPWLLFDDIGSDGITITGEIIEEGESS